MSLEAEILHADLGSAPSAINPVYTVDLELLRGTPRTIVLRGSDPRPRAPRSSCASRWFAR
ncbi:MAG: hypothetical protein M3070_12135 [Actinomycetota bacterium]|nr:hypothetical protein [Actinomycetota bacterium]